jgi:hypothetical protein
MTSRLPLQCPLSFCSHGQLEGGLVAYFISTNGRPRLQVVFYQVTVAGGHEQRLHALPFLPLSTHEGPSWASQPGPRTSKSGGDTQRHAFVRRSAAKTWPLAALNGRVGRRGGQGLAKLGQGKQDLRKICLGEYTIIF